MHSSILESIKISKTIEYACFLYMVKQASLSETAFKVDGSQDNNEYLRDRMVLPSSGSSSEV